MVRGPKKHLKRLNAPKHWMLDKLGGIFVGYYLFIEMSASMLNRPGSRHQCGILG